MFFASLKPVRSASHRQPKPQPPFPLRVGLTMTFSLIVDDLGPSSSCLYALDDFAGLRGGYDLVVEALENEEGGLDGGGGEERGASSVDFRDFGVGPADWVGERISEKGGDGGKRKTYSERRGSGTRTYASHPPAASDPQCRSC